MKVEVSSLHIVSGSPTHKTYPAIETYDGLVGLTVEAIGLLVGPQHTIVFLFDDGTCGLFGYAPS